MKILIAFLIIGAIYSCEGIVTHYLPAVSGEDGKIVEIKVELRNGSGIDVEIIPPIGLVTQRSILDALAYLKGIGYDLSKCNIKFDVVGINSVTSYVEGPSGGLTITLMLLSLLEKKEMRKDTLISGAIDTEGNVIKVGGIYEKAKSVAQRGIKYFLVPSQNLIERALLYELERESGIEIIEVYNVNEAKDFVLNRDESIKHKVRAPNVAPVIVEKKFNSRKEMENIAKKMINEAEMNFNKIERVFIEKENLTNYLEDLKRNWKILMENSYYYSAANDAFLKSVEFLTISKIKDLNLEKEIKEVERCLNVTKSLELSEENLEFSIGQEVRRQWAESKIKKVKEKNYTLKEEKIGALTNLMFSQSWCKIIEILSENKSVKKENEIDESIWKDLSEEYLNKAKKYEGEDEEIDWHIENARSLHNKKKYGAAIFESSLAIGSGKALNERETKEHIIKKELENLIEEKFESFWANTYSSHAYYLFLKNDEINAYKVYKSAKEIEEAFKKMKEKIKEVREAESELNKSMRCKEDYLSIEKIVIIIGLILIGISIGFEIGKRSGVKKWKR